MVPAQILLRMSCCNEKSINITLEVWCRRQMGNYPAQAGHISSGRGEYRNTGRAAEVCFMPRHHHAAVACCTWCRAGVTKTPRCRNRRKPYSLIPALADKASTFSRLSIPRKGASWAGGKWKSAKRHLEGRFYRRKGDGGFELGNFQRAFMINHLFDFGMMEKDPLVSQTGSRKYRCWITVLHRIFRETGWW